jgi:hypothetical protein
MRRAVAGFAVLVCGGCQPEPTATGWDAVARISPPSGASCPDPVAQAVAVDEDGRRLWAALYCSDDTSWLVSYDVAIGASWTLSNRRQTRLPRAVQHPSGLVYDGQRDVLWGCDYTTSDDARACYCLEPSAPFASRTPPLWEKCFRAEGDAFTGGEMFDVGVTNISAVALDGGSMLVADFRLLDRSRVYDVGDPMLHLLGTQSRPRELSAEGFHVQGLAVEDGRVLVACNGSCSLGVGGACLPDSKYGVGSIGFADADGALAEGSAPDVCVESIQVLEQSGVVVTISELDGAVYVRPTESLRTEALLRASQ